MLWLRVSFLLLWMRWSLKWTLRSSSASAGNACFSPPYCQCPNLILRWPLPPLAPTGILTYLTLRLLLVVPSYYHASDAPVPRQCPCSTGTGTFGGHFPLSGCHPATTHPCRDFLPLAAECQWPAGFPSRRYYRTKKPTIPSQACLNF